MKSKIIKIIIRGNIQNLKYSIHSLIFASKNTICNKEGKIIFSQNMNFIFLNPISLKKSNSLKILIN